MKSSTQNLQPNLFIVGAPKAGTSALHYILGQHPEVYMSGWKEPHYYSDMSRNITRDEYLNLFKAGSNARYRGEASVNYLFDSSAPDNIAKDSPNAKIIIGLRNPIDQMYSMYLFNKRLGYEEASTFEEALFKENVRKKQGLPPTLYYTSRAHYLHSLLAYKERFPSENIFIYIFEEFQKDNDEVVCKIHDFLKIESLPFRRRIVNRDGVPRSEALNRFLTSETYLSNVIRLLPVNMRRKLRNILRDINTKGVERERIDKEVRGNLANLFHQEVHLISDLLDDDLTVYWQDFRDK